MVTYGCVREGYLIHCGDVCESPHHEALCCEEEAMALVYGELYAALRSANVSHELAQEAARADAVSPAEGTIAKLKSEVQILKILSGVNIVLIFLLIAIK